MNAPTTSPPVADEGGGDIALLWDDALRAYQDETSRDLRSEPITPSLSTPEDLINALEIKGAAFKGFRNKRLSLCSRLHSVVGPVSKLGAVAQGSVSLAPFGPAASAVLGSVIFLLTVCNEVSNAYDWIENVFSELQGFAERLAQYAKSDMDAVMKRHVTAILVFFLRVFGRSEALVRDKRFKKYLKTVFLGEDSKTKGILDDLKKQTKGEIEFVIASNLSTSKATLEATTRLEKSQADNTDKILSTIKETTASRETEKEQAELKRVLGTEAAENVYVLYTIFCENMLADSAMWLEKEELYQAWQRGESPVLWVLGGPGSGKSYLMTRTAETLNTAYGKAHDTLKSTAVAYFFIKDGRYMQQDPRIILKTWAFQISDTDALFAKHALAFCRSSRPHGTTRDLWKRLFLDFYASPKQSDHSVVLLLDGLDEAPIESRREILTLIESLLQSSKYQTDCTPRIKIAVFSRLDVRSDMSFLMREACIEVSSEKNEHDMRKYTQERLEHFSVIDVLRRQKPNGHKKASKYASKIMRKVLENADGVVLWAQLFLQEMENKDQPQIESILANPPRKLDGMIADICHRIANDKDLDQRDVRTLLSSLSFVYCDLNFAELHALLCLPKLTADNLLKSEISLDAKPLLWNNIRGKLASFLTTTYSPPYPPDEDDKRNASPVSDGTDGVQTGTSTENSSLSLDFSISEGDDEGSDDAEGDTESNKGSESKFNLEHSTSADSPHDIAAKTRETLWSLQDAQKAAFVAFTHLRIKDYLILEGCESTRQYAPQEMNFDPGRVHIDMTIDCIRILRLWTHVGVHYEEDENFQFDYPMQYLFKHLRAIDHAHLTDLDERRIATGLVWLFGSNIGPRAVVSISSSTGDAKNALTETLFSTNEYTQNLKDWLVLASKYTDMYNKDLEEWVNDASSSTALLLLPLATEAARFWLQSASDTCDVDSHTCWYFFVLQNVVDIKGNSATKVAESFDWELEEESLLEGQSEETILGLANWPGFPRNATWYTKVAIVLLAAKHDATAAEYFKQALEMDSKLLTAREGLAICLDSQEHYDDALDHLIDSIADLPPSGPDWLPQMIRLAELQLAARRIEACMQSLDEVFGLALKELDSPDFSLCNVCVRILYRAKRSDKIVEMLRHLDGLRVDSGLSLLDRYLEFELENVFVQIGRACRLQGQPAFIAAALNKSWELFTKCGSSTDATHAAAVILALFKYFDRTEDVTERAEFLLEFCESTEGARDSYIRDLIITCRAELAVYLLDKAITAHPSQVALDYAAKVKALSDTMSKDVARGLVARKWDSLAATPALLYGRWLREYAKAPRWEWRKYFQARILQQLALLDDDDPSNDVAALITLAGMLFHAGDKQNAAAALAVLYTPLEASKKGTLGLVDNEGSTYEDLRALKEQVEELTLQVENKILYNCQECGEVDKNVDELYMCEICLEVILCGNCVPKLHTGTLSERTCDPKHERHRIWPIPEDAKRVASRISEGKVYLQKLWLDALREEWSDGPGKVSR